MMKIKYLIRLDDACPTMDRVKWKKVEEILDRFKVKPMVGIIPANADPKQVLASPDSHFWQKVKEWENKGWSIALHGFDHCYISNERGINPLWPRSEFAGVPLSVQKEKIRKGVEIFTKIGINPKYFFAPSHTFDSNTLEALHECSDIRIISDTIAFEPYRQGDFVFIPQLGGACRKIPFSGTWTFCLHPSAMEDKQIKALEEFLANYSNQFLSFDSLSLESIGPKTIRSKMLSGLYFAYRKIKGL